MEEAKAVAHQQHQQFLLQQQQQFLLLQQLQKQHQLQQQQQAISGFPSNIDAHLRNTPGVLHHRLTNIQQSTDSTPNPNSTPNSTPNQRQQQQQQQQQRKQIRPFNQTELQMAYQDAWRVCHPDFKRPFSSLEDACDRLLPYHVVADHEAEEDDRILDSDTTSQMPPRF